ncbi:PENTATRICOPEPTIDE REPEAT-CONTAINING PROTEIN-RELATED [Salix purpurea]|uniref:PENTATRICOPEPTIDE REPEAT-CONTAINING PROTEIN-RELATED n=1 Tax=Salix purpurea TaxID=77065 RepID=A0A9Q0VWF7_SALPP|nr:PENTATRICOPEPTIDE REPEAT-CONTAINING PROTEIN-RELATED [Salix purpurea]
MSSLIVTKSADIRNRLIQGFSSLKHLKHIHAALLRLGLDEDTYLLNQVLRFSFNFGNTSYSYRLLYQTKEPNIFLFNTMIRGLVLNYCFQESIEVYHSMRKEGLSPDSFTFPFVLKACARVLDSELGLKMHSLVVKAGCEADVFVNISLVNLYAKCGFIDNAFKVFDDIPEKNFASWTATISGYVGVGKCKEAIEMFRRLLEKGLRPDSFSLVEVLSACKRTGDLRSGEWIDEYITEIGMVRNVFVATALVDFYVKCGNMVRARSVFDGMLEKNIVSWSSMIQGYASNGLPKEALDLFFKMLNEGLKPDCYAMVGVLCSCARLGALELGDWASNLISGHEFLGNPVLGTALIDMYAKCGRMDRAWEVFRGMRKKDGVVWNAAISGLAMSGHVKDAFGLFGQMEKSGIKPDRNTFVGLLCACTHAGLVDEGRQYFNSMERVFKLTPEIEHYGCMVDLLGRAGCLDEAHQLIKGMPIEANAIVWGALLGGCRLHRDTQLGEVVLKQLIALEPWHSEMKHLLEYKSVEAQRGKKLLKS